MSYLGIGSQLGTGGELTASEEALVQDLAGLNYVTGDILYYNGTQLINLGAGSNGQVLTLASGVPVWADSTGGTTGITVKVKKFTTTGGTQSISLGTAPSLIMSVVVKGQGLSDVAGDYSVGGTIINSLNANTPSGLWGKIVYTI